MGVNLQLTLMED